jgi:hypothetical protein
VTDADSCSFGWAVSGILTQPPNPQTIADNKRALLQQENALVPASTDTAALSGGQVQGNDSDGPRKGGKLQHVTEPPLDEGTKRRIEAHARAVSQRPPLAAETGHRVPSHKGSCVVCSKAGSTYKFESCGHLCICQFCADNIRAEAMRQRTRAQCPLCCWFSDKMIKVKEQTFTLEDMGLTYGSSPHARTRHRVYRLPLPDGKAEEVKRAQLAATRTKARNLSPERMWRGPGLDAVFEDYFRYPGVDAASRLS